MPYASSESNRKKREGENSYTIGRTPWMGNQSVTRTSPTQRITQTQNKSTKTSMPQVGFELTIPVFEMAKRDLNLRSTNSRSMGYGAVPVFV
jgi:hypothetical protein